VWLALAQAFRHGSLYVPMHAGDHYGGGRYMPLGIILDGTASKVVGSEIIGSKLVSLAVGACLFALVVHVCRRLGCDWATAVGLAAVPFATIVGLEQVSGVRNDILPVVLELAAVAIVWEWESRQAPVVGGAVAGLAFAAKTASIWGLAVVVWWCWRRSGKTAAVQAAIAGIAVPGVVLAVCGAVSHGNLFPAVFGSGSFWPPHVIGLLQTVGQVQLQYVVGALPLFGLVVALLLVPGALARTPFPVALIAATVVTIPLFLDNGINANHFIDMLVLTAVVAATVVRQTQPYGPVLASAVRVAAVVGLVIGLTGVYAWPLLHRDHTLGWHQFAAEVRPGDRILSEDSSVPVSLGQRPQVLDAFALHLLDKRHTAEVQPLIDDINNRVFSKVLLTGRPESDTTGFFSLDFGPRVIAAIERNYHFDHVRGGLDIYVPNARRA